MNVKDLPKRIEEKVCPYTLNSPERGQCLQLRCTQFICTINEKGEVTGGNCGATIQAVTLSRIETQLEQLNSNISRLAFARGGHRG